MVALWLNACEPGHVDITSHPAKVGPSRMTPHHVAAQAVMAIVRFFWLNRRLRAAVIAALISAPALAAPADQAFRQGLSAYNSGDFQKAMKIWLPLAQGEDPASQAGIGFMYHRGLGVATDNLKAAYWLRKAAEHGQPEGQFMLGSLYFYGNGVEKSYVQAYAWCDLAQDGGNADAQSCRDAALQSLGSNDELKAAFRLSQDLHQKFRRAR
jgi:TPR repeat protein